MIARRAGHVVRTLGETIVAAVPGVCVGDAVRIERARGTCLSGEVVAVERDRARIAPFGSVDGIAVGDRVSSEGLGRALPYGAALLGRAIDAAGTPLDGGPPPRAPVSARTTDLAPAAADRVAIDAALWTGVSAIDALLTVGRGARIGIFGAPGAGKSSLLESIVAHARADAVVLALVGERGREAGRWLERLDARTTIVCATSDRSATERVRAGDVAMLHACALRARGLHVLLVVDSLARYAAALRERRAANGEPVGRGGYPPGVWFDLARYLERAGNAGRGSVSAIVTVLSDGADEREPLSEAARSLLDGHVALSSELAAAGRFPAIDVLASASRTMADCASSEHRRDALAIRKALAYLAQSRDARELGLAAARDPRDVRAVALEVEVERFLRRAKPHPPAETLGELRRLARELESPP